MIGSQAPLTLLLGGSWSVGLLLDLYPLLHSEPFSLPLELLVMGILLCGLGLSSLDFNVPHGDTVYVVIVLPLNSVTIHSIGVKGVEEEGLEEKACDRMLD